MELILNLVWAATGLAMLVAWWRMPRHEYATRAGQALCLAVAILLLLPVISLSDDLVAAQMTTETDCCVRRAPEGHGQAVHPGTCVHVAIVSAIRSLVEPPEASEQLAEAVVTQQVRATSLRLPYRRPPPTA